MNKTRKINSNFQRFLDLKEEKIIELYSDLRMYILDIYPNSNELLYHTHALTSVYSISEKLSDAFCMIPIYKNHLNLGFNKGTLLEDPEHLLKGTGKLIRHIPITTSIDYKNEKTLQLIKSAISIAIEDMDTPSKSIAKTYSKIKLI